MNQMNNGHSNPNQMNQMNQGNSNKFNENFFFLTNNNSGNISGNNLNNNKNITALNNSSNQNSFENNIQSLSTKNNKPVKKILKSSKNLKKNLTTIKSKNASDITKNDKNINLIDDVKNKKILKQKNTKTKTNTNSKTNSKTNFNSKTNSNSNTNSKTNSNSKQISKTKKNKNEKNDDNVSTSSIKSIDSDNIDQEIIKLKKKLREKNIKSINKNKDNDSSFNNSDNELLNETKSNVKLRKNILEDNLLETSSNSNSNSYDQTKQILQSEKKDISDKTKALFKLLVDAKKNTSSDDISTVTSVNSNQNISLNSQNNKSNKINMEDNDNSDNSSVSDESMTLSFKNKISNIYIDSDTENNVRNREYNNKPNQNQNQPMNINQQISNIINDNDSIDGSKIKHISVLKKINNKSNKNISGVNNLLIVSNQVTEKECYNDYMIKLSEPIRLRDLNINNILIPKRKSENILDNNNQLEIEIDLGANTNSDPSTRFTNQIIELDTDYYNRNEIVEYLNECFDSYELNINTFIDFNDRFVFESKSNTKFKLISSDKSILPYLGFGKNTYFNKTKYIAENSLDVGDNIFYLVIENISDEPMFRIDMDGEDPVVEKLLELDGDIEIDHLIIKFNKTKNSLINNDSEYSFFFESEHEIDFEFI